MTEDEARKLGTRMIDTWPNGPKAYIWRDLFLDLDPDRAADAYRALLAHHTKPPTPADFTTAYRNTRTSRPHTPRYDHDRPGEPVISFSEYLARLMSKADAGNEDAAHELERWERFTQSQRRTA